MQGLHPVPADRRLWDDQIPGGGHWSGLLRRGRALRLAAQSERVNVSALFYRADQLLERYNMPDTLKAQHTARLTAGHVLYSDMGRVMCSVIADSRGWHDALGGLSTDAGIRHQYGEATYQDHHNAMYRSAETGLLIELGKFGLGRQDLVANVNFFSKVVADDEGQLRFDTEVARPDDWIDLRFDMDTVVVLSTAPHPLDPRSGYAPGAVALTAWQCGPADARDRCRNACAENQRGFYNTDLLYL